MSAQRLLKWQRWIDDVGEDLFELWFDEIRWRQLHELARDNTSLAGAHVDDFIGWIDGLYLQAAAVGVRRQSEVRSDSISIGRLLREVAEDPAALLAAPLYAAVCQGHASISVGVCPSEHDIALAAEKDASLLRDAATSITKYVNKSIAHRAKLRARGEWPLDSPAVEHATGLLREILGRYTLALKGTLFLSGPLPEYDWMESFTVPWTTSEQIIEYFRRDYGEDD